MNYDLTTKQEIVCVKHKKVHFSEGGWRYTKWNIKEGIVEGWGCANVRYPEFVPKRIHEERVTFANDQLQEFRGGERSREFIEAHPKVIKQKLRDGAITKKDIKNSKYVWKDVKGVTKNPESEELINT